MHTSKSIVSCDLGTQSHDPLGCKCVNIDQANPRPKVCIGVTCICNQPNHSGQDLLTTMLIVSLTG